MIKQRGVMALLPTMYSYFLTYKMGIEGFAQSYFFMGNHDQGLMGLSFSY